MSDSSSHPATVHREYGLPPELVDKIIGLCSYDWKTLLSLTLICKSWLPLVHAHLFDRIRIQLQPRNEQERRLDKSNKVLNSSLEKYIRHVSLEFNSKNFSAEKEVEYITNRVNKIRDRKSGNILTSLCIDYYDRPDFAPYQGLFKSLPSLGSFVSIVELNIWLNGGKVPAEMFRFICSFPHLQILGVYIYSVEYPSEVPKTTLPPSLKSIHLDLPSAGQRANDYPYEWLSLQSPAEAISELSLFSIWSLNLNACTALFSKSLRALDIGFDIQSPAPVPQHCNLSPFEVLESLTFVNPSSEHHFETIRLLLETVSSSHLRTFSMMDMSIGPGKPRGPRHSVQGRLRNLDVILATEKFSRVTVEIHFSVTTEAFPFYEQTAKRCFEKCLKQDRFIVLRWLKHRPRRRSWTDWGIFESGMKFYDWTYY
ncbi:hypothetical protein L218DRAFT_950886 [Marasmius fiardii PR-910]|nr:hypothetical protein L218DRAFT_950886 [Marasmius fiardii PR-910]